MREMKGFKCIEDFTISDCCSFLKIDISSLPNVLNTIQVTAENSKVITHARRCLEKDRNKFVSCSTIKQYKAYLSAYPDGLYRKQAADRIELLKAEEEEKSFYDTNKISVAGCEAYLKRYPNGRFVKEASIQRENLFFVKCRNSKSGCEQYLAIFPNGRYAEDAKEIISKAKKNRNILIIAIIVVILLVLIGYNGSGSVVFSNAHNVRKENQHHLALKVSLACSPSRMLTLPPVVVAQSSNSKKIHFPKEGGTQEVIFSSGADNDNVEVNTYSSWINVRKTSAGEIIISVSKNEGEERSGSIEVKAYSTLFGIRTSSSTGTIYVTQATGHASYINVSSDDLNFSVNGGTKSVRIDSDGYWEIGKETPSWMNINKNNNVVTLTLNENSGVSRSGNLVIKSGSKEKRVKISQSGKSATYLNVSLESVSFSSNGGSRTITVSTDGEWQISTGTVGWGHTSISGNTITLRIDENTSSSSRTDYFVIKSGSKEKRINISQGGKPATRLSVSTENVSFGKAGGHRSITVSTNGEWRIGVGTASWAHTSISGNTITLRVDENNSGDERTDYFTVVAGDKDVRINITQTGGPSAEVNSIRVEHNIRRTGYNSVMGPWGWQQVPYAYNVMRIHIDFDVNNMKGKTIRVCAFFFDEDGDKLTTSNNQFRAPDGQVTVQNTGTATYENSNWSDYVLEIPYGVMRKGDNKFYIQIQDNRGNTLTTSSYEYFSVN